MSLLTMALLTVALLTMALLTSGSTYSTARPLRLQARQDQEHGQVDAALKALQRGEEGSARTHRQ